MKFSSTGITSAFIAVHWMGNAFLDCISMYISQRGCKTYLFVIGYLDAYTVWWTWHTETCTCSLYSAHWTLYGEHCKLYGVHCTLYGVHCTLYGEHCTLYGVHCTLYGVHCTLYGEHCTLYGVHCTLHSAHPTLFSVHRTLHAEPCEHISSKRPH